MKKLLLFVAGFILSLGMFAQQTLIISEVADPTTYQGRFVELYNATTQTIDLAADNYYLSRQSNGSSWGDVALTGTIAPGQTYVIAYSSANFTSAYGFEADQYSGIITGNGDDGYFLYKGGDHTTGTLIDAYGVINQDGTGQPWEYTNSHAVRNSNIGTANSTWTASEWTITAGDVDIMTPGQHQCDYPQITPTKLAITQVTPNPQYANWEFDVTVQAQDNNGTPGNVSQATTFNLTTDGTGNISIVNGTAEIPAGQNSVTLTVRYDVAETFNLGATVTAGDALADATPVSVTINPMPTNTISTTPDSLVFDKNPTATLHDYGIYVYTGTTGSPWAVRSYSGDYFMKASNYVSGGSVAINTWAIMPKFTGANNAIANFVSASYNATTNLNTTFSVKVSTDYQGYGDPANATWTDLSFTQPTGGYSWVKSGDIDLSAYNGQDFYLAFVLTSDGSDNNTIEVDSMVIYNQSGTTAINEVSNNALSIYPNPVSNVLYVNATGNLDIVDNTGRVVKHVIVKGAGTIDVADLQPGIYFARLTGESKAVSVRKFIKR